MLPQKLNFIRIFALIQVVGISEQSDLSWYKTFFLNELYISKGRISVFLSFSTLESMRMMSFSVVLIPYEERTQ